MSVENSETENPHIDLFASINFKRNKHFTGSPLHDNEFVQDSELHSKYDFTSPKNLKLTSISNILNKQQKGECSSSVLKPSVKTIKNNEFSKKSSKSKSKIIPGHQNFVFDEKNPDYTLIKDQFTKTEIKEAFDYLAMTNSKTITFKDLEFFLEVLEEDVDEDDIKEMIRMCDFEGNNQVRYEEFEKMASGQSLAPIGQAFPPTLEMIARNPINMSKLEIKPKKESTFLNFDANTSEPQNLNSQGLFLEIAKEKKIEKIKGGIKLRPDRKVNRLESVERFLSANTKIRENLRNHVDDLSKIDVNLIEECEYANFLTFFEIDDAEKNKENKEINREAFNSFVEGEVKFINLKNFVISLIGISDLPIEHKIISSFNLLDEENVGYLTKEAFIRLVQFFQGEKDYKKVDRKIEAIFKQKKLQDDIITKEIIFGLFNEFPNIFIK